MVGVPPQSANERRENDRTEDYYQQLEDVYSTKLIALMRWSLIVDPMQRPQSVFAMQKALRDSGGSSPGMGGRFIAGVRRLVS